MKTILVTGGAGYIGSHTVIELAVAGYRPVIIDNFTNAEPSVISRLKKLTGQNISCYQSDYQNTRRLRSIIATESVQGVIHIAGYKAVIESVTDPLKYYDNNTAGLIKLLQVLLSSGVSNFVFSSTASVYGQSTASVLTETMPCHPLSPYARSKYVSELVLQDVCRANTQFKAASLRYFNVIGAHESGLVGELSRGQVYNLVPAIFQALSGRLPTLEVFGTDYPTPDGSCQRDYVHVVDVARAHVAALDKMIGRQKFYEVYNIGTGQPTSVLQLLKAFEIVNKVKIPYKIGQRRTGDSPAYYASAHKALSELAWQSSKTLEEAIRDAWVWQQSQKP